MKLDKDYKRLTGSLLIIFPNLKSDMTTLLQRKILFTNNATKHEQQLM